MRWVWWSVVVVVGLASPDDLCHPSCHCLDTFFDCRRRALTSLPHNLPNWVQKLNMSFNEISGVEGLSSLVHLTSLSLEGNNLSQIPTASLPSLLYLGLSRNGIRSVEGESLDPYTSLRELDLSRNRIESLNNASFPPGNSLATLNLGGNQMESLEPGSLDNLGGLTELILSRNRIKSLSKDLFSHQKRLEKLDLSRNRLETLDSLRFQEMKKLTVLNLRRNHMANLSDAAFYGLDNLEQLYLDGNSVRVIEKRWLYGLRSLGLLNLSRNALEGIEQESWEFMEQLNTLDLSWNGLVGIVEGSFKGLGGLQLLDLSHNKIFHVDTNSFLTLESLEVLDLSHNELSWVLEDVDGPFDGLGRLRSLELEYNRIRSLHPSSLSGLSSLRTLGLNGNPLKALSPTTFHNLASLAILTHDISSFVCDCHALWLHSRLARSPTNVGTDPSPVCAVPQELQGMALGQIPTDKLTCPPERYLSRPIFSSQPKTQILLMEGNGSLSCTAESHSHSPLTISWNKDYQELPTQLLSRIQRLERLTGNATFQMNSTLNLVNVSWAEAGAYQCVAQNSFGVVYSSKANVTVHIFPSFGKTPSNVTVRLGSNAKLECGAKGLPLPEIAFQKDGGENFPAALDRRFHVLPTEDSFVISEVRLTDMGLYCCTARNQAGQVKTCASVTVYETPRFESQMSDQRVAEGSNTLLECLGSGSPKPGVLWSKDSVYIRPGATSRYVLKESGSLLIIKEVKLEDEGRYECLLSNAVGTARDFLSLVVIPNGALGRAHWSSPVMVVALVVVAGLCVLATVAAWVVVIFRDRRKSSCRSAEETSLRYQDLKLFPPPPSYKVVGDEGSHSSSGKDSGTGEDMMVDPEPQSEHEALMRSPWRKPELETFSTFGGRVARLSQHRPERTDSVDVISLAHPPGREFCTMPRKVPMPVPPPFLLPTPLPTLQLSQVSNGSCGSSSGYSSLGLPNKEGGGERALSVTSNSDGGESGLGTSSGVDSSTDALFNPPPIDKLEGPSDLNSSTLPLLPQKDKTTSQLAVQNPPVLSMSTPV